MGDLIKYTALDGMEIHFVGFEEARDMIVRGKKQFVTESELRVQLNICKARKLNPLAGDVCLVKYTKDDPLALIETRVRQRKVARSNPSYKGHKVGIIVQDPKGNIKEIQGTFLPPQHILLGAWFRCTPRGMEEVYHSIDLASNIKHTKDGDITKFWREDNQPFMLAKVAEAQGLKMAFPMEGQMLTHEEHTYALARGMTPGDEDVEDVAAEEAEDKMTQEQVDELLSRVQREEWLNLQDFLFQRGSLEGHTLGTMQGLVCAHILENWENGVQLEFQQYLDSLEVEKQPDADKFVAFGEDLEALGYRLLFKAEPMSEDQEAEIKKGLIDHIKGIFEKHGLDPGKTKTWLAEKTQTFEDKIPKNEHGKYSLNECSIDTLQEMKDTVKTWLPIAKKNGELKKKGKKGK